MKNLQFRSVVLFFIMVVIFINCASTIPQSKENIYQSILLELPLGSTDKSVFVPSHIPYNNFPYPDTLTSLDYVVKVGSIFGKFNILKTNNFNALKEVNNIKYLNIDNNEFDNSFSLRYFAGTVEQDTFYYDRKWIAIKDTNDNPVVTSLSYLLQNVLNISNDQLNLDSIIFITQTYTGETISEMSSEDYPTKIPVFNHNDAGYFGCAFYDKLKGIPRITKVVHFDSYNGYSIMTIQSLITNHINKDNMNSYYFHNLSKEFESGLLEYRLSKKIEQLYQ